MCEGWSFEIGNTFRGAVVCQEKFDGPPMWLASVSADYLGEYLEREATIARVQAEIESNMELVLHDWRQYQEATHKHASDARDLSRSIMHKSS
jgi:hypothetical protein